GGWGTGNAVWDRTTRLGPAGSMGGPAQGKPLRPWKPMVGSPVNGDVLLDEGETGVLPPEHATQTALTLRTKTAGRYLIAKSPVRKRLTKLYVPNRTCAYQPFSQVTSRARHDRGRAVSAL